MGPLLAKTSPAVVKDAWLAVLQDWVQHGSPDADIYTAKVAPHYDKEDWYRQE